MPGGLQKNRRLAFLLGILLLVLLLVVSSQQFSVPRGNNYCRIYSTSSTHSLRALYSCFLIALVFFFQDEREVHPAETKPSSWWLSRGIEENGEAEGGGGGNREEGEDKKVAKGAAGGDNEVERGREEEEKNEEVEGDEDEETAGEDHDPPSSWVQKSSSVTTDV